MNEIDIETVEMMASEAAQIIRGQKRVIRKQDKMIEKLEIENRALRVLVLVFAVISVAAAVTLLIG